MAIQIFINLPTKSSQLHQTTQAKHGNSEITVVRPTQSRNLCMNVAMFYQPFTAQQIHKVNIYFLRTMLIVGCIVCIILLSLLLLLLLFKFWHLNCLEDRNRCVYASCTCTFIRYASKSHSSLSYSFVFHEGEKFLLRSLSQVRAAQQSKPALALAVHQ